MNIDDAKSILPWVSVCERGADGKPCLLSVPCKATERGRRVAPRVARVRLSRSAAGVVCDCRIVGSGDAAEPEQCKGMASGSLCYHALAALLACADEQGGELTIPAPPGVQSFAVRAGYSLGRTTAAYAKRCQHPNPPGVSCEFCSSVNPLPVALPTSPAKPSRRRKAT